MLQTELCRWRARATHQTSLMSGRSAPHRAVTALQGTATDKRMLQGIPGQDRQEATSHDEELAGQGAPLQLPRQAPGPELGHDQRQDGHVGAVLGHQAGCAPRAGIADDQAGLRMAASAFN